MGHTQVTTTQIYTAGADLSVRTAFLQAMQRLEDASVLPLLAPGPCRTPELVRPPPRASGSLAHRLRRWGAACAVQVSPHRLRHTFATRLLNGGMPLDTIRRLLGHRTLSMTQRYAHLHDATAQRQFQEAMRQLEGIAVSNWPQPIQTDKVLVSTQTDSV
jgi:hypothetical protein